MNLGAQKASASIYIYSYTVKMSKSDIDNFYPIEHLQLSLASVASVVMKMPASTVYLILDMVKKNGGEE